MCDDGQVAQSVEQRIENPCVGGSIPPLATNPTVFRSDPFAPRGPSMETAASRQTVVCDSGGSINLREFPLGRARTGSRWNSSR